MKNKKNKIVTFIVLSYFHFSTNIVSVNASYTLTNGSQLETFLAVGFGVVLFIVLLALILLIYTRIQLANLIKKKKKKNEEDYF